MMKKDGVTILDSTMRKDEVRIIRLTEILGFNIINETGEHLFIEPVYEPNTINKLVKIIIRK